MVAREGITPARAATLCDLQITERMNPAFDKAQATFQRRLVNGVLGAATGATPAIEGDWTPTHASDGSRALTRTRAWSKADWKAGAWLLERTFPHEYGQQSTVNLEVTPAASLLAKLADMASKRGELASKRRPALGAGEAPGTPPGTP